MEPYTCASVMKWHLVACWLLENCLGAGMTPAPVSSHTVKTIPLHSGLLGFDLTFKYIYAVFTNKK